MTPTASAIPATTATEMPAICAFPSDEGWAATVVAVGEACAVVVGNDDVVDVVKVEDMVEPGKVSRLDGELLAGGTTRVDEMNIVELVVVVVVGETIITAPEPEVEILKVAVNGE